MLEWDVLSGRLVPYWLTVLGSVWILAFLYAWTCDPGYYAYYNGIFVPLLGGMDSAVVDWSSVLVGMDAPYILASCACVLLLTTHRLPAWRLSWLNKIAAAVRRHPPEATDESHSPVHRRIGASLRYFVSSFRSPFRSMQADADYGRDLESKKANQFGRGEANFNAMAFWLAFLPMTIGMLAFVPSSIRYSDESAAAAGTSVMKGRIEGISYLFGWGSIMCLAFFLIPVTRHSVLLAAMGWSPIHALRIHIWFGYLSFVFMLIHGVMLVPVWFLYYDFPVWQQIVPNQKCWTWTWTAETVADVTPDCYHVFANWTGIVAAVFFIVLWGSSLHWVRRRSYRLFYILHVTFGTLTLLGTILHMHWFIIYFIPSITYYLASTTPTLVQALASRFRGGVKIRKVVLVGDSGGCVEVHLDAHETASAVLNSEPCQFVKLCVPKISLVWHPFDVYKNYSADGTPGDSVRFLFRPVGPFTKELAKRLTSPSERPVTLVDGFYRGADKSELALQHDCVTMVAGGVALSPYLTLIPALLSRISVEEKAGEVKTKSIVLHWVCREPGLCAYHVDKYLNPIMERARAVRLGASLSIYIYVTGGKKVVAELSESRTLEGSSRLTLADPVTGEVAPRLLDETKVLESDSNSSDHDKSLGDGVGDVEMVDLDSPGHPLELARVFPRRFSNPMWNGPLFVFYSGVTFFGVWYLFNQDPHDPTSYYELSKMTWITLYAVLMYVAFGMLLEGCVLGLRRYWPQPTSDQFETVVVASPEVAAAKVGPGESSSDEEAGTTKVEGAKVVEDEGDEDSLPFSVGVGGDGGGGRVGRVSVVRVEGRRPTVDEIFGASRLAAEPGIFVCGPSALTGMVRAEAAKENSFLGLTRYCLYDEPYEM